MPVSPDHFRRIMGQFATGVTIVTAAHEGRLAGMTANAITSVSLQPMLVLFCADRRARTNEMIDRSGAFALNILTEKMRPLSDLFADNKKSEEERFAAVRHAPGAVTGAPILERNMGWLECRVAHRYEGGDHTIFVGEVVNAGAGDGKPLIFYKGKYGRLENE